MYPDLVDVYIGSRKALIVDELALEAAALPRNKFNNFAHSH